MMLEKKTTEFLEALSSSQPVPGGGGASATVGALASALGMMVANLTIGKKKYADVEEEIKSARDQLNELMQELIKLTDKDAEVFETLSKAYGLPKETQEQQEYKEKVLKVMRLLDLMGEKGSLIAISDVGVGILFAQAALEGASLNIYINTKLMKDKNHKKELEAKADALIEESKKLKDKVYSAVMQKIRPV